MHGKVSRCSGNGVGFLPSMISKEIEKVQSEGLSKRVELIQGGAIRLNLDDNSFDVAAVAFGMRNMLNKTSSLLEVARVVIPNG